MHLWYTGMIVYQVVEDFSSNEITTANEERICEESKINRKDDKRPLSDYQNAINNAAGDICGRDPTMLTKKEELLTLAKQQVYESRFQLKKGNQSECCRVKSSVCKAYMWVAYMTCIERAYLFNT